MTAKFNIVTLQGIHQTGSLMERLATTYYTDVEKYAGMTLREFFDLVKRLKYIRDPRKIEFVHRPKFVLNPLVKFRDCDDKSTLLGAWLYLKKIPFRFLAVSNRPDGKIHHVLVQAEIQGKKRILDATYPQNKLFHFKPITKAVPISGWLKRM